MIIFIKYLWPWSSTLNLRDTELKNQTLVCKIKFLSISPSCKIHVFIKYDK